uniref:Ig-like domain-containing protein n=1 Tax=Pyxicephalus adspersus TaxID=30357 RepID=A0AAV3AY11_PYXAD|nr:TPA: hypothetical protein GDO54_007297 [Pyxicephalus adspersus]
MIFPFQSEIMDSQQNEKSVKDKLNEKNEKKNSLAILDRSWLPLLLLLASLSGSHCLDIKGELHSDVLLPCVVIYKDEFDYSLLVVNWQRHENDALVHSFYHSSSQPEYQEKHYQGRTQIFFESLPKGNASLLLKNLTNSDAGIYICNVILQQSSGYLTQYINLTVVDAVSDTSKMSDTKWILVTAPTIVMVILVLGAVLVVRHYKSSKRKCGPPDTENEFLIKDTPDPIIKYKEYMKSNTNKRKYEDIFERQLIVVEGSLYITSHSDDVSFGDNQKMINVKKLFTTANKHLMSKRMHLVGDAGTGKSYFCKWLEEEWVNTGSPLYQCIIYVSGRKINRKNEITRVEDIVEEKFNKLSEVIHMSDVLLILDDLDDLVCYAVNTGTDLPFEKENNLDTDNTLQLEALIKDIINEKLLPETNILIVSRRDSPFNEDEASNVYVTAGKSSSDDTYKSVKRISNNPAFVLMMCNLNSSDEKLHNFTSPYEMLIFCFLQQYLKQLHGYGSGTEILQLVEESYHNFVKAKKNNPESTKLWGDFLNFFSCTNLKYQCVILRDMLAALHCVWQPKMTESLIECLDFWLFGGKHTCSLLCPVTNEHNTKYYNFIRFFMRLLPYPNYDSLCYKTPNMDDNLRKMLSDYFKNRLKDHNENYEKLAVVHCVFELHDEFVTKEFSSIDHFSLLNIPLNPLDIRALVYCLIDARLQKLDLRLCSLTDKYVEQLKNIIKNTNYVL